MTRGMVLASRVLEVVNALAYGAFRVGLRRAHRAAVPVLSVGNIAVGGTGKTPLVAALARALLALGARPVILTRGYRRQGRGPVVVRPARRCRGRRSATSRRSSPKWPRSMRWARKLPTCSMLTSLSDQPTVSAAYFDGRSARPHPVTLTLDGDMLELTGELVSRRDSLATLRVSEPMGAAPRLISYPDGGHCEVRDHQGLSVLLAASGHRDSVVVRLQGYWRAAVSAVLLTIAVLAAAYVWGLPALSEWIAMRTPEPVMAQLGKSTLDVLDRAAFGPSKLPEHRQQQLREAFGRLVMPAGDVIATHRILFREGRGVGANALALPDGTIMMTDELVKLASDDEEILAVLAHELGHISRRHSLRMLIQGSIVAFVVSWYIGDVSSVAAGLPTLLLQASYSREHEAESDRYAAAMLRANGISPRRLGDMLQKLERAHRNKGDGKHESAGIEKGSRREGAFNDYFATHPGNAERIRTLGSL